MYTVFDQTGNIRARCGLPCFVRTLQAARKAAEPGDKIVGWSQSGYARASWDVGTDGRTRRRAARR